MVALANPITWHVDVLRYATIGLGAPPTLVLEGLLFLAFSTASFGAALWSLRKQE